MPVRKTLKKKATRRKPVLTEEGKKAQVASQVTFLLKGAIKRSRIEFIMVSELLARVRDENLYAAMKHPNIEDYAENHLKLGRSSLYQYLEIHDWIAEFHKEWFNPKPGMFIPDLSDFNDLKWIDNELRKKDVDPERRAALEKLQKKGVDGTLRRTELRAWRGKRERGDDAIKSLLASFRGLRRRCGRLKDLPEEVISYLDSAIGMLENARTIKLAGLEVFEGAQVRTKIQNRSVAKC